MVIYFFNGQQSIDIKTLLVYLTILENSNKKSTTHKNSQREWGTATVSVALTQLL